MVENSTASNCLKNSKISEFLFIAYFALHKNVVVFLVSFVFIGFGIKKSQSEYCIFSPLDLLETITFPLGLCDTLEDCS